MEKYSRWRDPSTGIQPFLHPKEDEYNPFSILKTGSALLLALVKIILIIILFILLTLLETIGIVTYFNSHLHRLWLRFVHLVIGRCMLFLLGFYYIKHQTVTLKKGIRKKIETLDKASGDIILSNHSSWIDIIYLQTYFSPQFTILTKSGVRKVSFFKALKNVFSIPIIEDANAISIKEMVQESKKNNSGPVVIFAEGTTSNGRGLLRFIPISNDCFQNVHLLGLKYNYKKFSPTFTVGTPMWQILKVFCQFVNDLEVKELSYLETESMLKEKKDGVLIEELRILLGQMLRLRLIGFAVADKIAFLEYYSEREAKRLKQK